MARITVEEYRAAVEKCLRLEGIGSGGSRIAAQVLLSAYDGSTVQLDITDLCGLDPEYYVAAMMVIRGRCELSMEPQTVIKDGDRIFSEMWSSWKRLHVSERGKPTCSTCGGRGKVYLDDESEDTTPCTVCGGTGRL